MAMLNADKPALIARADAQVSALAYAGVNARAANAKTAAKAAAESATKTAMRMDASAGS